MTVDREGLSVEDIETIINETESTESDEVWTRRMAKALHARLRAITPVGERAWKGLEWENDGLNAKSILGWYTVVKGTDQKTYRDCYRLVRPGDSFDWPYSPAEATIDGCKAAAQQDYASRVLSALEPIPPSPVRVSADRRAAVALSILRMIDDEIERVSEKPDPVVKHNLGYYASKLREALSLPAGETEGEPRMPHSRMTAEEAANFIDRLSERAKIIEECAKLIEEGFTKTAAEPYRNDGVSSKNDKCPHGRYMYEDCEPCCVDALRALGAP